MPRPQYDIAVIGNLTHDEIISPSGEKHYSIGGSPVYIESILKTLGPKVKYVAKTGPDFKYQNQIQFNPIISKSSHTTCFVNDYRGKIRFQNVKNICEAIDVKNLDFKTRVCIVSGVANEISPELILHARTLSEILIIDAQSLIRKVNKAGEVSHSMLNETPYLKLLNQMDYLKASDDEIHSLDLNKTKEKTCLLITRGPEGCTILKNKDRYDLPAFKVEVKDSTGAGDCFLAGFAYGLSKNLNSIDSARFGNFCGALAVQNLGVPSYTI